MRIPIKVTILGKEVHNLKFPSHVGAVPTAGHLISSLNTSSGGGVACYIIQEVVHSWDDAKKTPILVLILNTKNKKILSI